MTENELMLVDSNILIYEFDTADSLKQSKAKEILDKCWKGENNYAVSLQNISEFFTNITQKITKPISIENGVALAKRMLDYKKLIKLTPTADCVSLALNICARDNVDYWDALIAATMIKNGIFIILTENTKDFSKIKEITAKNPFS